MIQLQNLRKAKRLDNGEWVKGWLWCGADHSYITPYNYGIGYDENTNKISATGYEIDVDTICRSTSLLNSDYDTIYENDIMQLVLPDKSVRNFKVVIKSDDRYVTNLDGFVKGTSHVLINGVFFEWYANGECYNLLPCLDDSNVCDTLKMKKIGNAFDNPELLENQDI